MASKVLITGGAGFIGSHLADRLAADPQIQVIVLDNLRRGKLSNLAGCRGRIEWLEGDIRDRATIERAATGVETVYHLAAQSNVLGAVSDIDYSFTTNVDGTFEVLRAAKNAGVKRLVFTSSREIYGEPAALPVAETSPYSPKNAYGASKAAGEMYCRIFNSPEFGVRVVRLANAYGPRDFDRVIPIFGSQALRGEALTLYGGKQVLDFIWIHHIVEALMRAAAVDVFPDAVNIGTGRPTELRVLAERILKATGSRSELKIVEARSMEVAKFVAATERQKSVLGMDAPEDPLAHLAAVLDSLS